MSGLSQNLFPLSDTPSLVEVLQSSHRAVSRELILRLRLDSFQIGHHRRNVALDDEHLSPFEAAVPVMADCEHSSIQDVKRCG